MCISPEFFKSMLVMQRLADLKHPLADIKITNEPKISLQKIKLDGLGEVYISKGAVRRGQQAVEKDITFVDNFNFNDPSVSLTIVSIQQKKAYGNRHVVQDWKLFTAPHKSVYKDFKNKLQILSHYHDSDSLDDRNASKDYFRIFRLAKNRRIQKIFEKEKECSTNFRRLFYTRSYYGWWNGVKNQNPPLELELHIFLKSTLKRLKKMIVDLAELRSYVEDRTGDRSFSNMAFFQLIEIQGKLLLTTNEMYPRKHPVKRNLEFCCFYSLIDLKFQAYADEGGTANPVVQEEDTKEVVMNMIQDACFDEFSQLLSFYRTWGILQKIELRNLGVRIYIGKRRNETVFVHMGKIFARISDFLTRDFRLRKARLVDLVCRKFILLVFESHTDSDKFIRIFIPTKNIFKKLPPINE